LALETHLVSDRSMHVASEGLKSRPDNACNVATSGSPVRQGHAKRLTGQEG
jgi:hypothetical protein